VETVIPQRADMVMDMERLTASDLNTLSDQDIFRPDKVEEVIKSGNSSESSDLSDAQKNLAKINAGENTLDKDYDLDKYSIIEAYLKVDIDDSGINADVIVWVHLETREILRATYLYRVMRTGLRPFFKIGFHRRTDAQEDVGLVELLFSLSKEIDAQHNMRIDTGLLTSLPWGFYRPSNAMSQEKLPIEPGTLLPTLDPQRDVFFPNLGSRTSFGFQEEQALMNQVERLTSISDLSLGVLGAQGATRTATGASILAGETSANLDIFIRRMNRGWKMALKYLFHLLQQKLPDGFEFRITGEDGQDYYGTVQDRKEIAGMYDFALEPNSANSNPQLQLQRANQIYQMTQNPIDLQLGLVTPRNRYESVRNLFVALGVKDTGKYVQEPINSPVIFTPLEMANRILAGMDVPLNPTMDLQGFVNFVNEFVRDDDLLGQFGPGEIGALIAKMQEAQQLLAALQQAQNDQLVLRQQGVNAQANFGGEVSTRIEAQVGQGVLGE